MRTTIGFIAFIITFFLFPVYGQEPKVKQLIQEGVTLHDQGEYKQAIEKYNECVKATTKLHTSYL